MPRDMVQATSFSFSLISLVTIIDDFGDEMT